MSFTDIGDNELIYLIRNDNGEAKKYLVNRYRKRIYGIINSYFTTYNVGGEDYEDYYQDCFIVFLKCLNGFDNEHNFYNYLSNAIYRRLRALYFKKRLDDKVLSLDYVYECNDITMMDVVEDSNAVYRINELKEYIDFNFDETTKMIINYRLEGYTYSEIAKLLNINIKTLYRKLYKMRDAIIDKRNKF